MNNQAIDPDFTIFSIATNGYSSHLLRLLMSGSKNFQHPNKIQWIILTDDPEKFQVNSDFPFETTIVEIASLKWPEATLLRYEYMENYFQLVKGKHVIYLDADMEIIEDFTKHINTKNWMNGIALVAHPGYWRPSDWKSKTNFYLGNPVHALRDFVRWIKFGALGTWETNPKSMAFVRRDKRSIYVCGGTWMGEAHSFLKLCAQLSSKVKRDLENNYIALWHDESHLNSWSSENDHSLLLPSFCFDMKFPALKNLSGYIRAVDKKTEF